MRAFVRWFTLVAVLATCVAAALGARMAADIAWNAVVEYRTPYVEAVVPFERPTAPSAVASRTVLVIVDGLRLDASRDMASLNALRGYGSDLELTAPQPSLSYPNWTTLLSGAPPYVSGVVTNWHEGAAPPQTLFDTARAAGVTTVFVGPEDFDELYGVRDKTEAAYMLKWDEKYLSDVYVDKAIELAGAVDPGLLVIHLPDIDEAGHTYGGASQQYKDAVARVDGDIGRLVTNLQSEGTVFVIVSDHGHIDSGGHGGWEPEAVTVPGVFAGGRVPLSTGTGGSEGVASTVAALVGIPMPAHSQGAPFQPVVGAAGVRASEGQQVEFWRAHGAVVGSDVGSIPPPAAVTAAQLRSWDADAQDARLARERTARLPYAAIALGLCVLALVLILLASRQAFVATLAGVAAYYVVYNGLFFLVHGYDWSLSAFNTEDAVTAWLMGRMIEAVVAVIIGAFVAAAVYPLLRATPMGPRGTYLAGWLTLGPATALAVIATLGMQLAWFFWWWGVSFTWRLPDLMWGFKFDLDLVQTTAVGVAAVVTPLVTYLVGRYHPRMTRKVVLAPSGHATEALPDDGTPTDPTDI